MMSAGSLRLQAGALLLALAAVTALGWNDDGLWFQGDAPRHAATGLFFADLLRTLPADPLGFALAWYARYPVITPGLYPPLFYLAEGMAYLALPPTPWVGKGLVLATAAVGAGYAMAWGRRWLDPMAGWAGPLLLLTPGVALYANGVLLNVPATAMGLGALYHLRRALESAGWRQGAAFVALSLAAVLTYYPAVLAVAVALAWWLLARRWQASAAIAVLLAALFGAILLLAGSLPAHVLRNLPSLPLLLEPGRWAFYAEALLRLAGLPLLLAAGLGLVAAHRQQVQRAEAWRLAVGVAVITACLLPVPARDERYALLALPLLVLLALLGPVALARAWPQRQAAVLAGGALALVLLALPPFVTTTIPRHTGFDRIADYLAEHGRHDTVLYEGRYDGNFGFFLRASDPGLERRLVLTHHLLLRFDQGRGFARTEQPLVASESALLERLKARCGCRWVAFEVQADEAMTETARRLRSALAGPAFERVASFPVQSPTTVRVDLYRARGEVLPAPPRDLSFPTFGPRVFPAVAPLAREP